MQAQLATLTLICKRPRLGHSKQRLAQSIGKSATLDIANALLNCALEDVKAWAGPTVISPENAEDLAWFAQRAPASDLLPQKEGNLGDRINQLDAALRQQQHHRLIFIGSDCPELRPEHLAHINQALEQFDYLFIDSTDGGVVLMANRIPWPPLTDMPWSQPQLGDALKKICLPHGSFACTLILNDLDISDDLTVAQRYLKSDNRPSRQALEHCINKALPACAT